MGNEDKTSRANVKALRAERAANFPGDVPGGKLRERSFSANMTSRLEDRDGKQMYHVEGFATVYERAYPMWDMFGDYNEVMDQGALNKSLSQNPDVAFLVNHKGVTMARTTNGTLLLRNSVDPNSGYMGLHVDAWLNPDRGDVHDFVTALSDKDIDEMSFAFMLEEGVWDDDFNEFRITEADIHRGDVSGVNYGANPFTSIQARTVDILDDLSKIPRAAVPAAIRALGGRLDTDLSQVAERLAERSRNAYFAGAASPSVRTAAGPEDKETSSTGDVKRDLDAMNKPEEDEDPLKLARGGRPLDLEAMFLREAKEDARNRGIL